jgi:hypothetical protein
MARMKNRFIVSILEALERISDHHPAMGKPEVLASLSAIDNLTWQLLDDIKSQTIVKPAKEQHRLSPAERN